MTHDTALVFSADHPAFGGHFPGHPIVPGVLLLDAAIHALETSSQRVVSGVASAKFLAPVAPGDALRVAGHGTDGGRASFEIRRGEERAATGQLLLGPAAAPAGPPGRNSGE